MAVELYQFPLTGKNHLLKEKHAGWGSYMRKRPKRLKKIQNMKSRCAQLFKRWDKKDPEIVALWKKTRQWSLEAFDEVYELLGIRFDKVYFESEVEEPGKEIVEALNHQKDWRRMNARKGRSSLTWMKLWARKKNTVSWSSCAQMGLLFIRQKIFRWR